jgi:nucleotide-binding universal stress UspA family protein
MLLINDDVDVRRISKVMVAYDGSVPAKESLGIALSLVRDIKGGQLLITQVKADKKAADAITQPEKDPIFATAISEAKKQGVAYKCIVAAGNPGQEICNAAEDNNVDLLLLGSPDRRPSVAKTLPDLDRLLGKSISDYVRVKAPCPVLLTRSAVK